MATLSPSAGFVFPPTPSGLPATDTYLMPTGGGGGSGVDGYTLRSGDRLLVIDSSGNLVGLPPTA